MKNNQDEKNLSNLGYIFKTLTEIADDINNKLKYCTIHIGKPNKSMAFENSNVSPKNGLTVYGSYEACCEVSRLVRESRESEKRRQILKKLFKEYDFTPKINKEIENLLNEIH